MRVLLVASALVFAGLTVACGGGSNSAATPSGGTAASGSPAAASAPKTPVPDGTPLTAVQAPALLDGALLKPADLPGDLGWKIVSDTTQDNAAAATADPTAAASSTRCGRLLARTITNQPADPVAPFIAGQTVSFFSTATVYGTASGAADCAAEAATRYQQPSELAKAFGGVFVDPSAVTVTPVTFPPIGDGSFAVTLAGKVNASGTIIDLTILAVGFRQGAVSALVGSAANAAPSTDELTPLVGLVLRRIAAAEQG